MDARRSTAVIAVSVALASCGGATFEEGGVRVVPDRAYVFDLGDRVVASAYVTAYAAADDGGESAATAAAPTSVAWDVKIVWDDEPFGPAGRLLLCSGYAGFAMDESEGAAALAPGEAREIYVRASSGSLLACGGSRAVRCGEPVSVLLVPRGGGPIVTIPTTVGCALAGW